MVGSPTMLGLACGDPGKYLLTDLRLWQHISPMAAIRAAAVAPATAHETALYQLWRSSCFMPHVCSQVEMMWHHAASSQRHGFDAEGGKADNIDASAVCHLLCQQWPQDPGPDGGLVRAPDCTGSGRQGLVQVSQDTPTAQQAPETARDCPAAMTLLAL